MNFEQAPEFQKDLKRLKKKWRSLPGDISQAEKDILPLYVNQEGVDIARLREAFFNGKRATIVRETDNTEVVKIRLDVESLGSNDKVRVVFVAVKTNNTITFVELYAKNEKSREDPKRYKPFI